ncbi:MAG: 3-hydroxyacyl-CoA dehydrogenase [Candidatus Nitrosothermus koennekii]|nr:MAG: 3-hydroxyacyl-CoA dehydrogenase [Candidatus Nitrosothermus koennekii]
MKIEKITVLGSGTMGHGIAQVAAMNGYRVALRDIEQSFLDKAMEKVRWSMSKLVEKNKVSREEADATLARITTHVDLKDALKDSDLVIEAVPEDMNLKKKVYAEVDQYAEDKTAYASNTSTLPITELANLTSRPNRFIGIHFFNPPQLMPLVEIIPGASTDKELIDTAIEFVKSLKKEPVLCKKDVAGFIVNRIFIPLVHEAAWALEREKVDMRAIDASVKYKLGFPMGIFELADYTGIDVVHKATQEMYARDKQVVNPCPLIEQLYNNKHLGQKSGRGFYQYGEGKYARVDLKEEEATYDPVRLLAFAINNACWLITNDVSSKSEIEKAVRLGLGLKEGLFAVAEKLYGYQKLVDVLKEMTKLYGDFYKPDPTLVKFSQ